MKVTVRKVQESSGTRWCLDYCPTGGKRVRRFFKTRTEADTAAGELERTQRVAGEAWLALTNSERADLITGYEQIRTLGLTLHQILEQWRTGQGAVKTNGKPSVSFKTAGEEWIAHLRLKGRRPKTIRNYEHFLRRFGNGRTEQPVSSLTKADYLTWLNQFEDKVTWNSLRDCARAFSSFAREHKLISEDPIGGDLLPSQEVPFERPTIFTPEQVESMFRWVMVHDRELLAYVALATFCGIRPDELDRIDWTMIDLEAGIVDIPDRCSKTKRPRQVHMHATALAWVRLARENNSRLPWNGSARVMRLKPLRAHLGFTVWPHDIMRHTFGSYYCELTRSLDQTAFEMGNSVDIIRRHYRDIVRPTACTKFWSLTPEVVCQGMAPVQSATANP